MGVLEMLGQMAANAAPKTYPAPLGGGNPYGGRGGHPQGQQVGRGGLGRQPVADTYQGQPMTPEQKRALRAQYLAMQGGNSYLNQMMQSASGYVPPVAPTPFDTVEPPPESEGMGEEPVGPAEPPPTEAPATNPYPVGTPEWAWWNLNNGMPAPPPAPGPSPDPAPTGNRRLNARRAGRLYG